MSGQVPYVSQSVGMTAADAQQVGTDQTVVASTTSLTDINNVVRVAASLTGASITGDGVVSGKLTIGSGSTSLTVNGIIAGGYFYLHSGSVSPGSANYSVVSNGSLTYLNGLTSSNMSVNNIVIVTATSIGLAVTGNISSSGRTLVGTTTDDGVNALQVNGTAKASTLIAQQTGGVASNDVLSTTYKSGGTGSVITRMQTSSLAANVFDIETNDGSSVGYRFGTTIYDTTLSASYNGTTPWGSLKFATGGVVRMTIIGGTGATAGSVLMASGLAVSGTITPQQATTAGAPAYVKGAIYFDTTLNKLRVGGATAWETITSI